MKKITLSILTITSILSAQSDIELLKSQMDEMAKKIAKLEKEKEKDNTHIISKAPKLKISGKHFLGFVSKDDKVKDDRTNKFETRRNYFQIKAYFSEESKNYFRTTFDTTKKGDGDWNVRLKYAYLYLNNILPYTGVEIGQAHRPWIDFETHNGWNYRSISKVFVEDKRGAHLTNSADVGINFKTKTDYFSSEIGVFNGEGYHGVEDGKGLSFEWRLTAYLIGNTKHKHKRDSYANISFFGQFNEDSNKHGNEDLNWYGVHATYNQPNFLISTQYIKTDDANIKYAGEGYSINGELRFGDFTTIGRYDHFELDNNNEEKDRKIAGLAYKYNKNIEFIANFTNEKVEDNSGIITDEDSLMVTAEINW
jgi:hypothetical protein